MLPRSLQGTIRTLSRLLSPAVILSLWLAVTPAWAGSMLLLGAGGTGGAAPAYTGPGDVVSGASGWWGLRAYNVAYATGSNPAAIVCDSATFLICTTINILANGDFDKTTASGSSSCSSTCVVKQLYDQSGNGHNATCASATVCPTLTFNCLGTHPCMTFNSANSQLMTFTVSLTGASGVSFSSVFGRTGTSLSFAFSGSGLQILGMNSANTGLFQYASGSIQPTISDNAIHAVQFVANGSSPASFTNIDGVTTTGTVSAGPGNLTTIGSSSFEWNGKTFEVGAWDSPAFTGTQAGNLCHNQFAYWGTAGSC